MMRADKAGESTTTRRPHRSTRLATATLATATVLALVTACGTTEPGPTASPTTSLSATPSPTPTATALAEPTKPPEMERNDEVGAIAAAEYFMELYNYVIQTGDLGPWDAAADRNCGFCSNVSSDLRPVYAEGGKYLGGLVTITSTRLVGFDETLRVHAVEVTYEESESRVLDSDEEVVKHTDARSGWLVLDVGASPDGWRLLTGDARDEPVAP